MNYYKIADLNVLLDCEKTTMNNAKKYLTKPFEKADIIICSDRDDISKRASKKNVAYDIAAYLVEGVEFYTKLLDFSGTFFHASAVVIDNRAYLFSAPCGTGKSTHTLQWLQLFGDRAYIINDDKPAVRIIDDGIFVYGTPWSGKNDISVNTKAKLQGICFLERGNENKIELMQKDIALIRLFHSAIRRLSKEDMEKELTLINTILERIPIYHMECLPNIEAAKMSYEVMSKAEVI